MRLLTFTRPSRSPEPRIGAHLGDAVLDLRAADVAARTGGAGGVDAIPPVAGSPMPASLRELLRTGPPMLERVRALAAHAAIADPARRAAMERDGILVPPGDVRYLPPIGDAEKFLCVGKNYRQHLDELRRNELLTETPQEPTAFVKLNACLSGHDWEVERPDGVVRLDYEPELVFVIGRRGLRVTKESAWEHVAGVTILNDLTDRDLQKREVASGSRFWTGKNIPGFGPLGPWIVTMDEIRDPYDLWMTCAVNGEPRMRVNTADQIWKLPDILEHFTRYIPIEPGDLFSTGAPGGVAVGKPNAAALFLKPGDVVECGIEGVMTLRTRIIAPRTSG